MTTSTQPTTPQKALTIAPKASATALGGALTIVCLYATNVIWNITPPAEVASAVTVLVSFAAAWLAPPKAAA